MGDSLREQYGKLIKEIMINLDKSGYLSPKSVTYVAETLSDMDIDFDYEELQELFDEYLDVIALGLEETEESLKKKKVHVNKNAGDVEYNMAMFNKGFANTGSSEGNSFSGGESFSYDSCNDQLLEAGGYSYLRKKSNKTTSGNVLSKLFSPDIFSKLVLDTNLQTPKVINDGGHGTQPVDDAVENDPNKVFPQPGFSITSNPYGPGNKNTHMDEHHVFGYRKGAFKKLTVLLPHDYHTTLHNNIRKELYNLLTSDSEVSKILSEYNKAHDQIFDKDASVYSNRSGLLIRELEYTLREIAKVLQNNSKLSHAKAIIEGKELLKFIGESPEFILNQNDTDTLKIKCKDADQSEFRCLPIILSSDYGDDFLKQDQLQSKIIKTNGAYLTDIKWDDSVFMCLIIFLPDDPDKDYIILKDPNQVNEFRNNPRSFTETASDDSVEEKTESLNEAAEDSTLTLSPVLLRQILKNNLDFYSKRSEKHYTDPYYYRSYTNSKALTSICSRIGDDIIKRRELSPEDELNFDRASKLAIRDYLENAFLKNNKYNIIIKNPSDYNLDETSSYKQVKVAPKDVVLKTPDTDETFNLVSTSAGPLPLEQILDLIIEKKIVNVGDVCPMFLDADGNPVEGISIAKTGNSSNYQLLVGPNVDRDSVVTFDLTRASDKYLNTFSLSRVRSILANCWGKFTGLKKVIWDARIPLQGSSFASCYATTYENIFVGKPSRLPNDCFRGSKIQSISIPGFCKSIGTGCFCGCYDLTSVYLPLGVKLYKDVFNDANYNTVLYYPGDKRELSSSYQEKWGKSKVKKIIDGTNSSGDTSVKYVKLEEGLIESLLNEEDDEEQVSAAPAKDFDVLFNNKNILIVAPKTEAALQRIGLNMMNKCQPKDGKSKTFFSGVGLYSQQYEWAKRNINLGANNYIFNNLLLDTKNKRVYLIILSQPYTPRSIQGHDLLNNTPVNFQQQILESDYDLYQFYMFDFVDLAKKDFPNLDAEFFKTTLYRMSQDLKVNNNITNSFDLVDAKNPVISLSVKDNLDELLSMIPTAKERVLFSCLFELPDDPIEDLLASRLFNLDDRNEDQINTELKKIKLTPDVIKALNNAGYKEEDYLEAIENADDSGLNDLYMIILNSYYKAIISMLLWDYQNNFERLLLNKGVKVDYKKKNLDLLYKSYIDNFLAGNRYDDNQFSDLNKKGSFGSYYGDEKLPEFLTKGIINPSLREISNMNLSPRLWASSFNKVFEENLKNL